MTCNTSLKEKQSYKQEMFSVQNITERYAKTQAISQHVYQQRQMVADCLAGKSDRLLVVVGPCSIHDVDAAMDYALRLQKLSHQYKHQLQLVMRCYLEKPRTRNGWKGLLVDPDLDGRCDRQKGIEVSRSLLLSINQLGLGVATEFLCPISASYMKDLISWGAIGARTTESQVHRELASDLGCPIGFKNGTDGNIDVAIDAIHSAKEPQVFMGGGRQGEIELVRSFGNPNCHLVLRGGVVPNYSRKDIKESALKLKSQGLSSSLMVDCSHGNSQKCHHRQLQVISEVSQQLSEGKTDIKAVMIESFIAEGKQSLQGALRYGQSVTDACLSWQQTETALALLAESVELAKVIHLPSKEVDSASS